MPRKNEIKNGFFEALKDGLEAAIEHAEGKRTDLRTTSLPRPLKQLSKKEIADIRKRINVSQAVFAALLNISPKTVQAWEQGNGKPSGASLKLLSIARRDPKILMEA